MKKKSVPAVWAKGCLCVTSSMPASPHELPTPLQSPAALVSKVSVATAA